MNHSPKLNPKYILKSLKISPSPARYLSNLNSTKQKKFITPSQLKTNNLLKSKRTMLGNAKATDENFLTLAANEENSLT
jgi:hypothetical protein